MLLQFINWIFLFLSLLNYADCARILAIVPTPAYSHQAAFVPLWKALLSRGHHLTLLTTDPLVSSHPNLTQIDLQFVYNLINRTAIVKKYKRNILDVAEDMLATRTTIFDNELKHSEVQKLIKRDTNKTFDLLIAEYIMPAFYPFLYRYKCPFIGIIPYDALTVAHSMIGNPVHPIAYPDILLSFDKLQFTFKERLLITLFHLYAVYFQYYRLFPVQEMIARRHFGNEMPPLIDLAQEVDMLFIKSHPLLYNVRPSVPATIYLGPGKHLETEGTLDEKLQSYLDASKFGVIYFSLGSNVRSADLPQSTLNIILETFAELPYDILWKFEEELLVTSSNVKIFKWLPQCAVLQHPNVKLFITQGGVQSIDESIYFMKPMLGIPFYGDQTFNVMKLVSKGLGLYINPQNFDKKLLKTSIEKIISDPKFKANTERLRRLLMDEPMGSIDKAVWWTEYVIRNNGAKHLKGGSYKIPSYQYYFLDVIGFFIITIALALVTIVKLFKFLLNKYYKLKTD